MKTSFKKLISTVLMGLICQIIGFSSASAAIFICEQQEIACNEQGDRYLCRGFGWIVIDDFCSETDLTTKRPVVRRAASTPVIPAPNCIEECAKLPNPKAFLCEIYSCGAW